QVLLETQGIEALEDYFNRMKAKNLKAGAPKALKFILSHDEIIKAMHLSNKLFQEKVAHPKIEKLREILQKQFAQNPNSRVLVFNNYRDSAKFLQTYLNQFEGIKAKKFVGQAMKENDEGMSQKTQIKTIEEFKEGKYNTLVCTSVAEEGLDIPAVDLVIFFEAVPSEIRSIQRRGRTGRLTNGKAIVLMARNTRDEAFYWASQGKEKKMHKTLAGLKKEMSTVSAVVAKQTTLHKFNEEAKEKVLIYVDTREQASQSARELQLKDDVIVRVKQLDIGDFVLADQIGVERKTVSDFLQSMIDGRLFNQLISLAANYERPLIILEGDMQELYSLRNIHPNAIKGAMASIALNYRIPIIFTKDLNETVEWLYLIAKREQLGKDKDIRLRVGRKAVTEKELQQFIVESLPSVGPTLAKNLLKHFGSVKKVFNASEKQLVKVEKIGEKKAKEIRKIVDAQFNENKKEEIKIEEEKEDD
ncbi:MAG: ERCC4 domain-containing protein, partial [archaeon]|nr:ERCC4 domain-containing protein [archaeon]